MSTKKSFFENFSPKGSFFMGLGGGIVVLFVIGFFVLLGVVLSDDDKKDYKFGGGDTAPTPTAPAPAPGGHDAGAGAVDTNFVITDEDHIRGNRDAEITIVEFSDFECPFCSRFHPTVQRALDEYPNDVRWVYKHFPLTSIHPQAQPAAEASECAWDQGGDDVFWPYGDALFENQGSLGRDLYVRLAQEYGLDIAEFESCLDSGKFRAKVQADNQRGIAAGVRGTPGSFINGQSLPGAVPYEQVKQVIDSLL